MAVASIAVIYSGHWAGLGQASGTGRWWKAPVWWIWFRDGQCLRTSTRWRALALRACVRTQDASFSLQRTHKVKKCTTSMWNQEK
eukprot:scaffold36624_cov62-Phaeocystis_antarctica.AAC.1